MYLCDRWLIRRHVRPIDAIWLEQQLGRGVTPYEVVAGCVGPDTRLEYSVVGDVVNLASRVQDLTKQLGVAILVTDDTAARLGPEFVFGKRAILPVRGKAQPVGVAEVSPTQSA